MSDISGSTISQWIQQSGVGQQSTTGSFSNGGDTWTWIADGTNRTLTLSLNDTNAMRWTRQADGTIDMEISGTLTVNTPIT